MPKRYDAATKHLLESDPGAWMAFADLTPDGPLAVLDSDLSSISAAADGVYRVGAPEPWLAHFEFQASGDPALGGRLLRYNVLLSDRHSLPALTVVILLRPSADGPGVTGVYQRRLPDGRLCHEFHYSVVRVWEKPVEDVLAGGLATLPLAVLANVTIADLPDVLRRLVERVTQETTPEQAARLLTSSFVLMGMRHPPNITAPLIQGVRPMIDLGESSTYQYILAEGEAKGRAEGKVEGAISILMELGRECLGPPEAQATETIEAITDLERLRELTRRVLKVKSWDELLTTP